MWSFIEAGKVSGVSVNGDLVRAHIGRSLEDLIDVVFRGIERSV